MYYTIAYKKIQSVFEYTDMENQPTVKSTAMYMTA